MKTHLRRLAIVSAAAVAVTLGASLAPVAAGDDRGDDRSSRDTRCATESGRERRGGGFQNRDLNVIGLTADQRLICFREDDPEDAKDIGQVAGLAGDTGLVGIDFRPFNGLLYGVGNAGGVYTIDTRTAVATKVGQLSVALSGASFGVDVNPAADALRIISDTGQNLRFSFSAGTTTPDVSLTYPPNAALATGVTGAAYTNNDADPNTATTLYDLDSALDQIAIQSPANSGQLAATGKLGSNTTATVGFDIYSTIRNGTTVDVRGLASLTVDGQSRFYRITLFSGAAALTGEFETENQVIGIAIPLGQL